MRFAHTPHNLPMPECPQCEAPLGPKVRFCPACGAVLPRDTTVARAAATPTTTVAAEAAPASTPTERPSAPAPATPAPAPAPPPAPDPAIAALSSTRPPERLDDDPADTLPEHEDDNEVALSVRFPYALVAGHASIVMLRLENRSAFAFDHGEITLESRAIGGLALKNLRRLPPGFAKPFEVEIDPVKAGPAIFHLQLTLTDKDGRRCFRASCREPILAAPDGNINISIGDIQSHSGTGANSGLGADYGNVQISNLLGDNTPRTLNDLLTTEREEGFRALELEQDYGLSSVAVQSELASRSRGLALPRELSGFVQPATKLTLEPAEEGAAPTLNLLATPEFRLGRNRAKVDLPTWWWPRNADHDDKTRRISQEQVILAATSAGIELWDPGSANGTLCDGQPLTTGGRENAVRLSRFATLGLANDYELEVEHTETSFPNGLAIGGIERWSGPGVGDVQALPLKGCVNFTPRSCDPTPAWSWWLFTDIAFGSSEANPLPLDLAGLAEVQGRFHWYRGCFWIESIAVNNALRLNGRILFPGEIAPLTSGSQLQLGQTVMRVGVSS